MLLSAKIAPTFDYPVLHEFWSRADELGFYSVANYDHFYGLSDMSDPTYEGWTSLAAMACVVSRARVGCMVTGVTYRNPAVLAKMAVTVDHITGGRLDFGLGAGWHEEEHRGYGLEFPSPGTRVEMLDEALTLIRRLWTEDTVTFEGRHYRVRDALANPKPLQKPHPPIVVGGEKPKMLARHRPSRRRMERSELRRHRRLGADECPARRGVRTGRPQPGRDSAFGATVHPARPGWSTRGAAGPAAGAGQPRLRPRGAVVLSAAVGSTVGALRGADLADQMVPPAPAPKAPCVTGSSACIGAGPFRDRRIRPSTHVAKCERPKLTVIIRIAITMSAGM